MSTGLPEQNELRIRKAGAGDAEELAGLHRLSFPNPWPAETWAEFIADRQCWLQLAETADQGGGRSTAIGYVLARQVADEAEILSIGVAPGFRRRRVASWLLAGLFDDLAASPTRKLFLEVSVENRAALELYRSLGFVAEGRRIGYYRNAGRAPVDALVLTREFPVF